MNKQPILPGLETAAVTAAAQGPPDPVGGGALRLHRPDRAQTRLVACVVEDLVPADHQVRVIWSLTARLDLSAFAADLKVREGEAGRAATDPRLLVALWLWAATQGVGSAREVARLCASHDAYKWLCGGVAVNYHTLSDFRVAHERALDELLTQVVALLLSAGLVTVHRVAQDGTRVRASAGRGSFHRRPTLERAWEAAQRQVAQLKAQRESPAVAAEPPSKRQEAARQRAARQRQERVEAALGQMPELEAIKARHNGKASGASPRASTTDPQARVMKMPDGGFRPAYNIQLACDTSSRAIVGVDVTNSGSDKAQSEPMRQQVERRTGQAVAEHLLDGGYVRLEDIERATAAGTTVYAPPQTSSPEINPGAVRAGDSPAVAAWRERMASAEGQRIYRERASTCETINGDLRTYRGLGRLLVRGLSKVRSLALWSALAYNVLHFGGALVG
jgi:transposase